MPPSLANCFPALAEVLARQPSLPPCPDVRRLFGAGGWDLLEVSAKSCELMGE